MKVRYVLIFDGQKIESGSSKELRRIAANTDRYWELYKYIAPTLKTSNNNQKVTILNMREMLKMYEEGIEVKKIASSFHLTIQRVHQILKQMRLERLKKQLPII